MKDTRSNQPEVREGADPSVQAWLGNSKTGACRAVSISSTTGKASHCRSNDPTASAAAAEPRAERSQTDRPSRSDGPAAGRFAPGRKPWPEEGSKFNGFMPRKTRIRAGSFKQSGGRGCSGMFELAENLQGVLGIDFLEHAVRASLAGSLWGRSCNSRSVHPSRRNSGPMIRSALASAASRFKSPA